MDPLTKHTIFAMIVGYVVSAMLELPLLPAIVLGLIVAIFAHLLARMETNQPTADE